MPIQPTQFSLPPLKQPQFYSPLDAAARALGFRQNQQQLRLGQQEEQMNAAKLQNLRQAQQDEADLREAAAQAGGDPEAIQKWLDVKNPRLGESFAKSVAERRKSLAAETSDRLKQQRDQNALLGELSQGVTDDASLQAALPQFEKVLPGSSQALGGTFQDAAPRLKQFQDAAMEHSKFVEAQQKAAETAAKAQEQSRKNTEEDRKFQETLAKAYHEGMAGVPDQQGADQLRAFLKAQGASPETLNLYPPQWSPKSTEQAKATLGRKEESVVPHTITTAEGVMQWNPATHQFDIKAGNRPPTAAQINVGLQASGNFEKTGDEFLATIPAQWRKTVEKIANYDEDPTKVTSMRSGMREQVMQWVNQVNPDYLADQFANRNPTRKAFTTGTQGQQITAMNTAVEHIAMLPELEKALKNGSFKPGNELWNRVKTAFGEDAANNFDILAEKLAGEVASVVSKGQATVSGIAAEKRQLSSAMSNKQIEGYVKTTLPIMASKLHALDYQYHQAMDTPNRVDKFSALSPNVKNILGKYGINVDQAQVAPKGGLENVSTEELLKRLK